MLLRWSSARVAAVWRGCMINQTKFMLLSLLHQNLFIFPMILFSKQLGWYWEYEGTHNHLHHQVTSTPHPDILALTTKFSPLFQPPTSLPPSHTTNHSIHLSPNSLPVNVRPYRYPHFQKQEIETQVALMLQHGIIQPITSPFSSPVLLVKK